MDAAKTSAKRKRTTYSTSLPLPRIPIDAAEYNSFLHAVRDNKVVSGLTHDFYRYPARFSPIFVRETIKAFSNPGDVILDPFMGGGTVVVEARSLGRRALGVDINSLAVFISKTKTSLLSDSDIRELTNWCLFVVRHTNLKNTPSFVSDDWLDYYRNIDCQKTWPMRRSIDLAIESINVLSTAKQKNFARCVILNTAQWALDCRIVLPTAEEFRAKLSAFFESMIEGAIEYRRAVNRNNVLAEGRRKLRLLNRSAVGIEKDTTITKFGRPSLIVTSPPYPGVHVLYHRWQVQGRRETPAPYLIANELDGSGASYYTFGDRKQPGLNSYFENTYQTFRSIAQVSSAETLVVQMIAFSEPDWQLPRYLDTMEQSGFREYFLNNAEDSPDNRLWRSVPNRKWYADLNGNTPSSNEVVLFHKLK